MDLPPIERLQAVEIRPEDTIVVTLRDESTQDECVAMCERDKANWPDNKVVAHTANMDISIYRPSPGDAVPSETKYHCAACDHTGIALRRAVGPSPMHWYTCVRCGATIFCETCGAVFSDGHVPGSCTGGQQGDGPPPC